MSSHESNAQGEAVYRDSCTGDLFVVERRDDHYVYGRREFDRDGNFEPWSARLANLERFYVLDLRAVE